MMLSVKVLLIGSPLPVKVNAEPGAPRSALPTNCGVGCGVAVGMAVGVAVIPMVGVRVGWR